MDALPRTTTIHPLKIFVNTCTALKYVSARRKTAVFEKIFIAPAPFGTPVHLIYQRV